jgi:hypothetical protein
VTPVDVVGGGYEGGTREGLEVTTGGTGAAQGRRWWGRRPAPVKHVQHVQRAGMTCSGWRR